MNTRRNILIALILNVLCVSVTVAKSCPYLVEACECTLKNVTCKNLRAIPQPETGTDVIGVTEAYFLRGNIASIKANSLPANLEVLVFENHPLTNISDDAFQGSANTMYELSFSNAGFIKLPNALLKLTNLTTLIIKDTFIEDWNRTIIEHIATTLRNIILEHVGLIEWPSWFSLFHSLTTVDLRENLLQFLPEDAFKSSTDTLAQLRLDTCNLTQVPKALLNLTGLTYLTLNNNNITDVDGSSGIEKLNLYPFANILEVLSISSNRLTKIPDMTRMTKLEKIYFHDNQITDSLLISFPSGTTLLSLVGNKMTSVPAAVAGLTKLYYLFLSDNLLTEISFDQFPTNLTVLEIDSNKINEITDPRYNKSHKLNSVSLMFNPIKRISPLAFTNLGLLETLHLDMTDLTEIPLALTSLTSLRNVRLPDLPCPCPPSIELVSWYKSRKGLSISGRCNTGGAFADYLNDARQSQSPCNASPLVYCLWCRIACLFLLLAAYLHI